MNTQSKCPECKYELWIEESDRYVRITDNGKTVTACPNCGEELTVEDGEIVSR